MKILEERKDPNALRCANQVGLTYRRLRRWLLLRILCDADAFTKITRMLSIEGACHRLRQRRRLFHILSPALSSTQWIEEPSNRGRSRGKGREATKLRPITEGTVTMLRALAWIGEPATINGLKIVTDRGMRIAQGK